jgi:thiosulfate/3-mercaptopyruvate sulfurtransferase
VDYPKTEYIVDTAWLDSNLSNPSLRVIDCRLNFVIDDANDVQFSSAENDWANEHIPGAIYINIGEELSQKSSEFPFMLPSADKFADVMSRLGVKDGTKVVLYDEFFNIWAARLWWMLRAFGFSNAAVLNGGLNKWKSENRPMSSEAEVTAKGSFSPRPEDGIFVDKQAVLSALADGQTCIIDALNAEHYTGEAPVWVDRPGHIQNAKNLPFNKIVDEDTHTFLSATDLSSALQSLGVDLNTPVITYCHAGNAASSVAFAMALMGHDQVSIYDASLREWAADPELPMDTLVTD